MREMSDLRKKNRNSCLVNLLHPLEVGLLVQLGMAVRMAKYLTPAIKNPWYMFITTDFSERTCTNRYIE